jgi:hypothetical protein
VSTFAANPAGLPHVSLCTVEWANQSLPKRKDRGGRHPSYGRYVCSNCVSTLANFRSQCADENFARECVCSYESRLLLGHSLWHFPASRSTRSSASHLAPLWGLGHSRSQFENYGKERLSNFFWGESRPSALGSRAHSLSSAQCDPSNNGRIQQTETPSCTRTE